MAGWDITAHPPGGAAFSAALAVDCGRALWHNVPRWPRRGDFGSLFPRFSVPVAAGAFFSQAVQRDVLLAASRDFSLAAEYQFFAQFRSGGVP